MAQASFKLKFVYENSGIKSVEFTVKACDTSSALKKAIAVIKKRSPDKEFLLDFSVVFIKKIEF